MFSFDEVEALRKFDDLVVRKEILYGKTITIKLKDQDFDVRA